jgi:hypothetical protein
VPGGIRTNSGPKPLLLRRSIYEASQLMPGHLPEASDERGLVKDPDPFGLQVSYPGRFLACTRLRTYFLYACSTHVFQLARALEAVNLVFLAPVPTP